MKQLNEPGPLAGYRHKVPLQPSVRYFSTDERRVEELRSAIDFSWPQMLQGSRPFFSEFTSWFSSYREPDQPPQVTAIFPEPDLNLAFPYPEEELGTAYALAHGDYPQEGRIIDLLESYGLGAEHKARPVVALSGGEKLLLSFARTHILCPVTQSLILCSPTHWLNRQNFRYLEKLIAFYLDADREVSLLMLEGEPLPGTFAGLEVGHGTFDRPIVEFLDLGWTLELDHLTVVFPESSFPKYSPRKEIVYRNWNSDDRLRLKSPTLLVGNNGVGKSVFARLLARLVVPEAGTFRVSTGGFSGTPRLILQDCVDQLFGRSVESYLDGVLRFDERKGQEAQDIYRKLEQSLQQFLRDADARLEPGFLGRRDRPDSLLQARMALTAERLVSRPPLLVLDEPGWRLSQPLAWGLLAATTTVAHELGVALLVISHRDSWWNGLIKSEIALDETGVLRTWDLRMEE